MSLATADLAMRGEREADPTGEFGLYVFLAGEVLFFGGLLVAYSLARAHFPDGFAIAGRHTQLMLGTVNTVLLLSSSLLAAAAAEAAKAGLRRLAARLLAVTALIGLVFLAVKGIEYHREWTEGLFPGPAFHIEGAGDPPGAQLFYAFYYVATGLHALHVLAGVLMLSFVARALSRARAGIDARTVHLAGVYWHFVDIVWILLYPLIYLVGHNT